MPSSEASPVPDPTLEAERSHLADARAAADPDARAHRVPRRQERGRRLRGVPRLSPLSPGALPAGRPRPLRCSSAGSTSRAGPRRGAGTSAAGTSTTTTATRSSSTGGRTSRAPSTAPPGSSRWASPCGDGSASNAATLTAYEDEHLVDRSEADRRSAILANEIERPRTGPMRDIVATIQPEQDVVVRTDLATSVCVQGAPGTGKTAVGPAPRRLPALRAPRPAAPQRRPRGRPEPVVPALHRRRCSRRSARSRSARRRSTSWSGRPYPSAPSTRSTSRVLKGDARMAQVLEPRGVVTAAATAGDARRDRQGRGAGGCRRTSRATRCTP